MTGLRYAPIKGHLLTRITLFFVGAKIEYFFIIQNKMCNIFL
ncbi:hypothetical protein CHRYSEO8AT_430027 [Chryseobacterium sp. 8AT]|nr:hypothetical protein CHRYSEO8AT_430027 [Chryseobacterium sp. 8AT]